MLLQPGGWRLENRTIYHEEFGEHKEKDEG
jgi:hypothetical protein